MSGGEMMMATYGARLFSLAALLGMAISIYNYMEPMSGIAGTPGAMLAITATAILFVLGLIMACDPRSKGLRIFLALASLFGIVGTAVAAAVLSSHALLILMFVCLLGWFAHLARPRRQALG